MLLTQRTTTPSCREDAVNEIRILASISHNNVVSVRGGVVALSFCLVALSPLSQPTSFLTRQYCDAFVERDNLYIVMEMAQKGDLYRKIKKYKAANKLIKEDVVWSVRQPTSPA